MNSKIITNDKITEDLLKKLFNEEILALRIPNYISNYLSEKLTNFYLNHPKLECHPHDLKVNDEIQLVDYGVDRVGVSYNTTFGHLKNSPNYKNYFNKAIPAIREIRQECAPNIAPFDKLRLELDEIWSPGASIANFEGKKMHVGIARIMKRPEKSYMVEKQPHYDGLQQKGVKIRGQFSANIYIAMPNTGGELELWDVPGIPTDQFIEDSSEINWREILPQSVLVKPEVGELVIINTRKPHAVRNFTENYRISLQSFIGVKEDEHLMIWN
ncbi:hypothetical protein AXG55_01120 [Silvanigrella aquatica]|uniref:Uncharacterized protein n=2 Tax=Silvanigrella aquatica TaxID=1915309 RepID=A0A1L4D497_9BACT|nr:hypothetical protein AXG55_01120 [Silvanigrella aquatica]